MLTTDDKGGRGGRANADIGSQRGVEVWLILKSLEKWLKMAKNIYFYPTHQETLLNFIK